MTRHKIVWFYSWLDTGVVSSAPANANKKVGDGIKSVYQEFPKQITGLNEETAPALFQYLNAAA